MAETLWSGPTNVSAPVSAQTINTGAGALGTEYDNETNKHRFANLQLTFSHGTAPTSGQWLVYILYAQDGTNYEDGGTSTQPRKQHAANFPYRAASTSAQKISRLVPILPFKFKVLVWNDTNQNSASTAVTLDVELFGEEPT